MISDSQMYFFSNVHMKLYDRKTHRNLKEIHKKNRITKYALNGIASMIKGEFNNTSYNLINNYVPKYIALGTNNANASSEDITVTTTVQAQDNSLLSEITNARGELVRLRLEDVRREDSSASNDYIKIRYRVLIPSGTIDPDIAIQELGLFTNNTSLTEGLWARITVEPITIPDNSMLDVTWDVILASAGEGVYPIRMELWGEDIVSDTTQYTDYGDTTVASSKLYSSVIDGTLEAVTTEFYVRDLTSEDADNPGNYVGKLIATNNFNNKSKTVTIVSVTSAGSTTYKVYSKYDGGTQTTLEGTYSSSTPTGTWSPSSNAYHAAKYEAYTSESTVDKFAVHGLDNTGATVSQVVNKLNYKDVTYPNITWDIYKYVDGINNVLINDYDETKTYAVGDCVSINNSTVYCCNTASTTGTWDATKWYKIFGYSKFMTSISMTNENTSESSVIKFTIVGKAITSISSSANYVFNKR